MKHNWNLILCACFLACMMAFPALTASASRTADDTIALLHKAVPEPGSPERADACLALLSQEITNPSTPGYLNEARTIGTAYIQQFLMDRCSFAYDSTQRWRVRSIIKSKLTVTPQTDQAMRDRLAIILGNTGDKQALPALIEILGRHPDGFMRESAAKALGRIKDRSSIPALKHALQTDTYAILRLQTSCLDTPITDRNKMAYSPVRRAANDALMAMGEPVSVDAEILNARYAVPELEKVLYVADEWRIYICVRYMAETACPEAEAALQRYIDSRPKSEERSMDGSATLTCAQLATEAMLRSRMLRHAL